MESSNNVKARSVLLSPGLLHEELSCTPRTQYTILCAWHIFFAPGETTRQNLQRYLRNQLLAQAFRIFAQNKLIWWISKLRATRKARFQFFSPTSSGFSSHPGVAMNSTSVALFFSSNTTSVVNWLMSAFAKRFLNSERAFSFAAAAAFFSLWCCQPLYKIHLYIIYKMVVLTIVAPVQFEHPIEKPTYIRLLSCSLYNSWYNLKNPLGKVSLNEAGAGKEPGSGK